MSSVQALDAEKGEIVARLHSLKAGKAKRVTKEERDGVEKEWKKWSAAAKIREKISKEMWTFIEDLVPEKEKRADVRERLGLDE